jgi:hypothetical protein
MVQEHGSEEGVPEWTLLNLQHPSPLTVEQDGEDDGDDGEPCGWVAQEDVIEGCEEVLWVLAKPAKWDQREEKDHRGRGRWRVVCILYLEIFSCDVRL